MKKLGFSLPSKVILIFIGALILLGVLAWGFSKPWRGPWRDQMPKVVWINLRAHLIDVVGQIGSPPTEAKAREILQELKLELIVRENEKTLFATSTDIPPWHEIQAEINEEVERRNARPDSLRSRLGDFIVGRCSGKMFALVDRQNRQFVFLLPEREGFQAGLRAFSGFAFTIAFLLIVVLAVTNWLLRPLKPLMVGVSELSQGNLDYRVSILPRGEFRRVAEAFNGMAEALQRQLKSKDQMLMDVSHELRSPLGRIKMAAEMLPEENRDASLRTQIQADVREMEELVSELLELYRLRDAEEKGVTFRESAHAKSRVDIGALILDVVGPLVQQKPGVEYRLPPGQTFVSGDEKQLKRAIRNVIENGMKFSRHQTKPVEVTVEIVPVAKQEPDSQSTCVITVRDYGVGMTQEQCQRIFEPFYRLDSSRVRDTGGFGLGLPLAQAVIEAHGGKIECEAEPEKGCTFRIQLRS